jgi:hypothetical protein
MQRSASTMAIIGDVAALAGSFARHLRASSLSPKSIETYGDACEQFAQYRIERGMPTDVASIRREHVESFIEALLKSPHAQARLRQRQGEEAGCVVGVRRINFGYLWRRPCS